ncbi:sodium ABC transporter ATP-binding protein, partial [Bacillus nitratireducens]|nr:sodium ABC transporter ATP-binding protein [Bacillus nitratireducens]
MLELKDVCKRNQDLAVKNISFTLQRGYIMGFVGPNEAGTRTTIKMI